VETIVLSRVEKVPDDAASIILAAPKKLLLEAEKTMLVEYAKNGGRLLLLSDPRTTNDVKDIVAQFGIDVGNDVIIDQVQRMFAAPALGVQPVVTTYGQHPITSNFNPRTISVFNIASSVKPSPNKIAGGSY